MKILVGMPEKTARGGINACEPPFLRELENHGETVCEEIYTFDNPEDISVFQRARQVFKTAGKFQKILRQGNFNIFHINTSFTFNSLLRDTFTLFWLKHRNTKIFIKFHGSDAEIIRSKNFVIQKLMRYLVKKVAGIGVLSSEEKENFVNVGLDKDKFYVVKNAVTELPENEIERDFSISKEKPLKILFVARLIAAKGLLETIYAVSELQTKGLDIFLDILGDGEIRSEAENLVNKLKVNNLINFHGHVSEETVQKFYQTSDLLVFPTFHDEGFPMVIFNAMANSLPIVTTKIRAAADYLKDGENCLFCEAKNPQSVKEKITELYQNENLRHRMSENNFKLAKEFSAEKITPEYLEIYKKLL